MGQILYNILFSTIRDAFETALLQLFLAHQLFCLLDVSSKEVECIWHLCRYHLFCLCGSRVDWHWCVHIYVDVYTFTLIGAHTHTCTLRCTHIRWGVHILLLQCFTTVICTMMLTHIRWCVHMHVDVYTHRRVHIYIYTLMYTCTLRGSQSTGVDVYTYWKHNRKTSRPSTSTPAAPKPEANSASLLATLEKNTEQSTNQKWCRWIHTLSLLAGAHIASLPKVGITYLFCLVIWQYLIMTHSQKSNHTRQKRRTHVDKYTNE